MASPPAAAFCRAIATAAFACLLAACEAGRETTLARSARQRQLGAERAERQRLDRERELLRLTNAEASAELAAARLDGVKMAAELRANLAQLRAELEHLQHSEQDLAAARARVQQIEQELVPLRALEATLRDQEKLHAETAQRVAALTAEAAAASQRVAEQEAELLPRLQVMQARLAALQQVRAALDEAAKLVAPPPPAPAAPAVAEPKK